MALITKAIKGTQDTLPMDSHKVRFLEATLADIAGNYGFREIRTPVFEHTELFNRSVGDTTDVVQKEMYTFDDKGGRSITLRPEGTAGAVRSFLEHGLFNEPSPMKVYYLTSCYRYEKPRPDGFASSTSSVSSASARRARHRTRKSSHWPMRSSAFSASRAWNSRSTRSAARTAVPSTRRR